MYKLLHGQMLPLSVMCKSDWLHIFYHNLQQFLRNFQFYMYIDISTCFLNLNTTKIIRNFQVFIYIICTYIVYFRYIHYICLYTIHW
jgi:hypothetical protein